MRSNLSKGTKLMQTYLVLLFFTLLHLRYCFFFFFLQIGAFWQLCFEQVYQYYFATIFVHFMSLCHILLILVIFQTLPVKIVLFDEDSNDG